MKKINYTRLLNLVLAVVSVASLLWITACSDDDGGNKTPDDETAPSIAITSPTAGTIGVSDAILAVNSTITDNTALASVEVTIGNGTTELYSETVTTFSNPMSFTYNKNITLPDDAPIGEHTLTILATDEEGNEKTSTVTLTILPAFEDGKTTVLVTSVPEVTGDDDIYMVGDFMSDGAAATDWNVGAGTFKLTKYVDSEGVTTYYISVKDQDPASTGGIDGFKFVRGTDWPFVQKDAEGREQSNNSIPADTKFIEFEIGSWADYNPKFDAPSIGACVFGESKTNFDAGNTVEISINNIGPSQTGAAAITNTVVTVTTPAGTQLYNNDFGAVGSLVASFDLAGDAASGIYKVKVVVTDANGHKNTLDELSGGGDPRSFEVGAEFSCTATAPTDKTVFLVKVPNNETGLTLYVTGDAVGGWSEPGTGTSVLLTEIGSGCYKAEIETSTLVDATEYKFFKGASWNNGETGLCAGNRTLSLASGTDQVLTYTIKGFQ